MNFRAAPGGAIGVLRVALLAALLALAACSGRPTEEAAPADNDASVATVAAPAAIANAAVPPAQADPALRIDGEGLRLVNRDTGAARPIAFGTPRDAVMTALAFRGPPSDTGTIDECSAGRLDTASWSDGLTLYFQDAQFAGWALGEDSKGALTTASGIGIGSTRAELKSAYAVEIFESTLGTEFTAGNLFGILDGPGPGAKITHLWAGTSCNMR